MSQPIYGQKPINATGIKCPNLILQQFTNINNKSVVIITQANQEFIIFKILNIGAIVKEDGGGGNYVYEQDWEPTLISRKDISNNTLLNLFDSIVINTEHWGKPAEMSLQFLAKTLD